MGQFNKSNSQRATVNGQQAVSISAGLQSPAFCRDAHQDGLLYSLATPHVGSYNAPSRMSPARILNISVRPQDQATVVDLDGAIDIQNSKGLRTALFEKLAETPRLAVNMAGIRYIDSSGIATLIEVL